ncbi:MAG: hypothetical protein FWB96_06080 [Defluviitaleaceae bacterium]|nr:hypothetical protein [Defluviitaleaceae bacterium]MCL2262429.1 hypothetical protein [Defluviitaleaceae bacterium]
MFNSAKEIFFKFGGRHFHMAREEVYDEYKQYGISLSQEREWRIEMRDEIYDKLIQESNNRIMADLFAEYGNLVEDLQDEAGYEFMLDFTRNNVHLFDSMAVLWNVNFILGVRGVKNKKLKTRVIKESILLLQNILSGNIYVSEDHYTSEELSVEKISERIKQCIKYGEQLLMRMKFPFSLWNRIVERWLLCIIS